MAAGDKIYGSFADWCEIFSYLKHIKPLWLQRMYPPPDEHEDDDYPIINLSIRQRRWLWRNCDIPFVMDAMIDRFGPRKLK